MSDPAAPPAPAGVPAGPTRLVLVRHGESVVTVQRRIGGHEACEGLSELGRRQGEALRDRLARTGELAADVLIASTMPRAVETAEIIAPALGLPVQLDPDVAEHDPGPEVDGLTFDEFVHRFGMPDWVNDPYLVGFPGGETVAQFHLRAATALHRIARDHAGRCVVIACHGGVVDVALRSFLRLPLTGGFELHTVNTSLTELLRAGEPDTNVWRLLRYNDAGHLAGLPSETPRQG